MPTYVYRFVDLETLPGRLSDVTCNRASSTGDVKAIRQRLRSDRRAAAALQMLFLRACGRGTVQIVGKRSHHRVDRG